MRTLQPRPRHAGLLLFGTFGAALWLVGSLTGRSLSRREVLGIAANSAAIAAAYLLVGGSGPGARDRTGTKQRPSRVPRYERRVLLPVGRRLERPPYRRRPERPRSRFRRAGAASGPHGPESAAAKQSNTSRKSSRPRSSIPKGKSGIAS